MLSDKAYLEITMGNLEIVNVFQTLQNLLEYSTRILFTVVVQFYDSVKEFATSNALG